MLKKITFAALLASTHTILASDLEAVNEIQKPQIEPFDINKANAEEQITDSEIVDALRKKGLKIDTIEDLDKFLNVVEETMLESAGCERAEK